jgi:pimeloyl-ACP methyl ester carboxylesterase
MDKEQHNIAKLFYSDEQFITYQQIKGNNDFPHILFLSGFNSNMFGTKAEYLYHFCKKNNYNFTRFDYFGHGLSSGAFVNGCISLWLENCLKIIDDLIEGKVILIGSSMGGWLSLLTALKRPAKIKSILGIASAPDFTEDLIWNCLNAHDKEILLKDKIVTPTLGDCHYQISLKLIEDGRNHLLLNNNININVPIMLLHGMQDKDVPYMTSIKLAEQLTSNQVKIKIIKNADHRMSKDEDLTQLGTSLQELIKSL